MHNPLWGLCQRQACCAQGSRLILVSHQFTQVKTLVLPKRHQIPFKHCDMCRIPFGTSATPSLLHTSFLVVPGITPIQTSETLALRKRHQCFWLRLVSHQFTQVKTLVLPKPHQVPIKKTAASATPSLLCTNMLVEHGITPIHTSDNTGPAKPSPSSLE